MKILVNEKLSQHKMKTPEGYLICTDAILARTGKQEYLKRELFGDSCEDSEERVDVDRPYDEVFSKETLASFENKPVTIEHPDTDVNINNYKDYAVGYVRDIRQNNIDGVDVIVGDLIITDSDAISKIESGEMTDLSCGYDCEIVDNEKGEYMQTKIRGNHVALCEEGRAGNARIIDSAIEDATYSDKEIKEAAKKLQAQKPYLTYEQCLAKVKENIKNGNYLLDTNIEDAATNGKLKDFRIEDLVEKVKQRRESLYSLREDSRGYLYDITINGSFDTDLKVGNDTYLDIVEIDPKGGQKRVLSKNCKDWRDLINNYNSWRRMVKDSYIRDKRYQFPELTNEDLREAQKYNLRFIRKIGTDYVLEGQLRDLKRYADNWLGYELVDDYFLDSYTEDSISKDDLRRYLKSEGISESYAEPILEHAKKGKDDLEKYLKWEGINGYTETLWKKINDSKVEDTSINDLEFKYMTEAEKELKEALGLYHKVYGSHQNKSGIKGAPRQNQKNNDQVAELHECINEAIRNIHSGVTDKSAWNRLSLKLEGWESDPEYSSVAKKANNAIKKFKKYLGITDSKLTIDKAIKAINVVKKVKRF